MNMKYDAKLICTDKKKFTELDPHIQRAVKAIYRYYKAEGLNEEDRVVRIQDFLDSQADLENKLDSILEKVSRYQGIIKQMKDHVRRGFFGLKLDKSDIAKIYAILQEAELISDEKSPTDNYLNEIEVLKEMLAGKRDKIEALEKKADIAIANAGKEYDKEYEKHAAKTKELKEKLSAELENYDKLAQEKIQLGRELKKYKKSEADAKKTAEIEADKKYAAKYSKEIKEAKKTAEEFNEVKKNYEAKIKALEGKVPADKIEDKVEEAPAEETPAEVTAKKLRKKTIKTIKKPEAPAEVKPAETSPEIPLIEETIETKAEEKAITSAEPGEIPAEEKPIKKNPEEATEIPVKEASKVSIKKIEDLKRRVGDLMESESEDEKADEGQFIALLTGLPDSVIDKPTAEALVEAGYTDLNKIKAASVKDLAEVRDITPTLARKIKTTIYETEI